MGTIAQMKAAFGNKKIDTYSAATTINIPNNTAAILVDVATGGVSCSKILTPSITTGQRLTIIGTGANSMTLTDNSATTTEGQFDLRGSDLTVRAESVFTFVRLASGAWRLTNPEN